MNNSSDHSEKKCLLRTSYVLVTELKAGLQKWLIKLLPLMSSQSKWKVEKKLTKSFNIGDKGFNERWKKSLRMGVGKVIRAGKRAALKTELSLEEWWVRRCQAGKGSGSSLQMKGTARTFPTENSVFRVSRECIWAAAKDKPRKGNRTQVLTGSVGPDNIAALYLAGDGKSLLCFEHEWPTWLDLSVETLLRLKEHALHTFLKVCLKAYRLEEGKQWQCTGRRIVIIICSS